jgi:hypothetical protein
MDSLQGARAPLNGAANAEFGNSVSIDGNTALVGEYFNDENGTNSGAAYVFLVAPRIFADGFESGDTSAWSSSTP